MIVSKGVWAVAFVILKPLQAVDLEKIRKIVDSSASDDFTRTDAYTAASAWNEERLVGEAAESTRAPYVACADYVEGPSALASLESSFGGSNIQRVSNSQVDGSCFIVTASPLAASAMLSAPGDFNLVSAGSFLPSLKLAKGLLDHGSDVSDSSERLRTSYGETMDLGNIYGLHVRLSPGVLPMADESSVRAFVRGWYDEIMQTVSTQSMSFWSDPNLDRSMQDAIRATVVDNLASTHGRSVGEICNLRKLGMRYIGDDLLVVEGERRGRVVCHGKFKRLLLGTKMSPHLSLVLSRTMYI